MKRRPSGLPDEVEGLVQETLLALHLQSGTYDPTLPVSAWTVAIARHKLVDLWSRHGSDRPPALMVYDRFRKQVSFSGET